MEQTGTSGISEVTMRGWRVGRAPLKAYVASAVYWTLDHFCAWTGHLRGCWLLNRSPVKRLWWWAGDHDVRCWRRAEGAYRWPDSGGSDVLERGP